MKLGRINSLYKPHLSDNNNTLTEENSLTKKTIFYTHNFDKRVKLFNSILQSTLFKNQNVCRSDLQFWFPECMNIKKESNSKFINKQKLNNSIECVLAELMEEEIG
mgnify:CR=1 FL=1